VARTGQRAVIRSNIFQYRQGTHEGTMMVRTKSSHPTRLPHRHAGNQPPPKGVWLQKTRLTTGGRPPLAGVTALLFMLTTDRQPPLLGVGPGSQPPPVGGRQPQSVSKERGLSCNRMPLLGLQFMSRATVTYSTNGPS
jgi:hypothetical protein